MVRVVLPMYMGVILLEKNFAIPFQSAPHVYGGDPLRVSKGDVISQCSPCIWG